MATIANLMVNFSSNIASMVTDFDKTSKAVRSASSDITATLGLLKTAFAGVLTLDMLKMGGDFIGQQMDIVEANKKTADSLGISYAAFVNMQQVAKESGVDIGALTGNLDKMEKSIYTAAAGTGKQSGAFAQLGLNVKDLMALTPDQQFAKIAAAISQIASPTERVGVAMAIFGKGAGQIVNIFNDYNAKSADAAAFTSKFGLALSDIDAQKVVDANDAMARLKTASDGLADTVAVHLSPLIEGMAKDWMNASSGAQAWGEMTDKAVAFIINDLDALELTMKGIKTGWDTITTATVSGATAIYASVTGQGDLSKTILDQGHEQISKLGTDYLTAANSVGTFGTAVKKYYADSAAEAAAAAKSGNGTGGLSGMNGINGVNDMNAAISRQKALLKSIVGPALTMKQTMADLDTLYGGGKGPLSLQQYNDAMDKLQLQMDKLGKTASSGFSAGFLEVKQTFSDVGTLASKTVVDGFKNAEDAIVQFATTGKLNFKTMVDSMITDLIRLEVRQNITGPLFSAISGAAGGSSGGGILSGLSSMFSGVFGGGRATGGPVNSGTTYLVGENGPELLNMGSNSGSITPNGAGAAGGVTINIINNTSAQVTQTQQKTANGGFDISVMIDQVMAAKATDPGSLFNRANRNNGVMPMLTQR